MRPLASPSVPDTSSCRVIAQEDVQVGSSGVSRRDLHADEVTV